MSSSDKTFTITDESIGIGAYGEVFISTDDQGNRYAIKKCDLDSQGVPNVLEASIMTKIVHPSLNSSLHVLCSDQSLYYIQELADNDLCKYTRKDKMNHVPSKEQLKKWCHSIAQGLYVLHSLNIIHADVKASNIILFKDGNVKLTDFTLSTRSSMAGVKFTHSVCTCTHRPLECLIKKAWNKSLDVWSLGCTFYEIAFGHLLFPFQGKKDGEIPKEILDEEAKEKKIKTIRHRAASCIIDC